MTKDRQNAINDILARIDYPLEIDNTMPGVTEITARTGGDIIVYRIYNDGSVTEK